MFVIWAAIKSNIKSIFLPDFEEVSMNENPWEQEYFKPSSHEITLWSSESILLPHSIIGIPSSAYFQIDW